MFSQTVEYALRAMICLAEDETAACTSETLSLRTHVPKPYLSKIMKSLVQAGLVRSQRGVNGGFLLARGPQEISILEVVDAIDPIPRIRTCPLGLAAHGAHLCPLHQRMDEALAGVELAFQNSTLAEVLAEPSRSRPLCSTPADLPCQ